MPCVRHPQISSPDRFLLLFRASVKQVFDVFRTTFLDALSSLLSADPAAR